MTGGRTASIVRFDDTADADWVHCAAVDFHSVFIGARNDPAAPVGIVVRAGRDVGDRIASTRIHPTATFTVVTNGTIQYDGRWMRSGEIHVAPAGIAHGDVVVGPQGATWFILFSQRSGLVPQFADPDDQRRFDSELRPAVQRVAHGLAETSVAILPLRENYSVRRGIKVLDVSDVKALMNQKAPVQIRDDNDRGNGSN